MNLYNKNFYLFFYYKKKKKKKKKFEFKIFMNLYSKTFYILNFQRKKNCMVKYTQNQEFTGGSKGLVWGRDVQ